MLHLHNITISGICQHKTQNIRNNYQSIIYRDLKNEFYNIISKIRFLNPNISSSSKASTKKPLFPLLFGNTFALTAIESFDVLQLHETLLLLLFLPLLGQFVLIVNKSFSTPLHPLLLIVNKFPLSLFENPPCY